MNIESIVEKLNEKANLSKLGLSVHDFNEEMTTEEICEYVRARISEHEVISYHVAIEFLSENDPSLKDSLELANDACLEIENINSEILATLLIQRKMEGELSDMEGA